MKRIALIICILWAAPGFAAFTVGNSGSKVSTDGFPNTSAVTVDTTGAKAVAVLIIGDDPCSYTPADTLNNTWTQEAHYHHSDTMNLWWYVSSGTALATGSDTFQPAGGCQGFPAIAIIALNSSSTTDGDPFISPAQGNTASSTTTIQAGSNAGGAIVLSGIGTAVTGTTLSIDSSFTIAEQKAPTSNAQGVGLAYKLAAGTVNPTWTLSASGDAIASNMGLQEKFLICTGSSPSWTAVDWSHVQVCHVSASDGDTITVSSGSYTVSANTVITKYVKIIAGGTVTLTDNTTNLSDMISITEATAGHTRLQGFTFVQGTAVHSNPNGVIKLSHANSGLAILITGNSYTNSTSSGDFIIAQVNQGLIWNNTQTGYPASGNCFDNNSFVRHKWTANTTSWTTVSNFGSADSNGNLSLFIEGNTLLNVEEAIDVDDNARTVLRFNHFTNSAEISHGVDTSGIWAARSIEIYGNDWHLDSTTLMNPATQNGNCPDGGGGYLAVNVNSFISPHSGTAFIFKNAIPDATGVWGVKASISMSVESLGRNAGGFPCWGTVTLTPGTYPAPHQVGWGWTGASTATITIPAISQPPSSYTQDHEPMLLFNNTGTGNYGSPSIFNYGPDSACTGAPDVSTYIQNNRDYYLENTSPPNPLTTGIGVGARSSRPSGCTTGVYWFATDQGSWNTSGSGGQGVLDKCTSTNTWTNAWYVPFSYPHPLEGSSSGTTRGRVTLRKRGN